MFNDADGFGNRSRLKAFFQTASTVISNTLSHVYLNNTINTNKAVITANRRLCRCGLAAAGRRAHFVPADLAGRERMV
ncbi:hypothetical protein E4T85_20355 [Bacillus stratosphericus]|nr:hypothetical protein E4T85_20355 [Bacillus stratosphericus]